MSRLRGSIRSAAAIAGVLAGLGIATGVSLAHTNATAAKAKAGKAFTIPVVLDQSGAGSPYATRLSYGLQLGFDAINNTGGIISNGVKHKVNLQINDTTSSPTQTSSVMHSLAGGSAPFVIGELLSSDAEAAFPIAKSAGLPTVIGTVSDRRVVAASRPYAFTTFIPVQLLIPSGIKQWVAAQHPSHVALVEDTTNDATEFQGELAASSLKKDGVPVANTISVSTGQPSYQSQASQIASEHPKGVVIAMIEGDAANLITELRGDGYKGPILLTTVSFAGAFLTTVPTSADTNINVIEESWPLTNNKPVMSFQKNYQSKFKTLLDDNGVVGYEMAYFIKEVVQASGILNKSMSTTAARKAVLNAMQKFGSFSELGFNYKVSSGGYFTGQAQFLSITHGKVSAPAPKS
jgi:branched-chain amino acid transport system substrate-binding protein